MGKLEELSDYPRPGVEVRLIERFVSLKGKRILEIGCGDGRLTLQLAALAAEVIAIDPSRPDIDAARQAAAAAGITNVWFQQASAEKLPVGGPFDVALFSWSL